MGERKEEENKTDKFVVCYIFRIGNFFNIGNYYGKNHSQKY